MALDRLGEHPVKKYDNKKYQREINRGSQRGLDDARDYMSNSSAEGVEERSSI